MGPRTMMAALALVLAGGAPAAAETVRSASFEADIQRRAIAPLSDGSRMSHLYVAVKTSSGAAPSQSQVKQAGAFAARAGCRNGTPLSTIMAGVTDGAAQFEVLCKGGR